MDTVLVVLLVAVAAALVVAGLVFATRRYTGGVTGRPPPRRGRGVRGPEHTLVLDLGAADPDTPHVQRLVDEVARSAFAESAETERVTVTDREGRVLGTRERPRALPDEPDRTPLATPDLLPRGRRARGPRPPLSRDRDDVLDLTAETRSLSERYDLPASVRDGLRHPDDPIELVRAIVAASGRAAVVEGNAIRSDDDLIVVLSAGAGGMITGEQLSNAFLRFQESRVPRGVVISVGYVNPAEVRRRELLAPALRHAGPEAIQRMADAVAAGADPVRFVTAPAVVD